MRQFHKRMQEERGEPQLFYLVTLATHPESAEASWDSADESMSDEKGLQHPQLSDVLRKLSDERIRDVQMPQTMESRQEIRDLPDRIHGDVQVLECVPQLFELIGDFDDAVV